MAWYTDTAAVSSFWNTNMAAVMPYQNPLFAGMVSIL